MGEGRTFSISGAEGRNTAMGGSRPHTRAQESSSDNHTHRDSNGKKGDTVWVLLGDIYCSITAGIRARVLADAGNLGHGGSATRRKHGNRDSDLGCEAGTRTWRLVSYGSMCLGGVSQPYGDMWVPNTHTEP